VRAARSSSREWYTSRRCLHSRPDGTLPASPSSRARC
jgi:hypothetical protein